MADTSSPAQKRKRANKGDKVQDEGISSSSETEKKRKKAKTASVPQDIREQIKSKFKVDMPQDFYDFYEFCKILNPHSPEDALKESLGLQLVGPFDIMTGWFTNVDDASVTSYHLHWRYYYDPPEFLTVIKGDEDQGYHIGYFRDEPKALPVFVASNKANVNCEMNAMGENLFAAVSMFLCENLKKTKDKSRQNSLKKLQTSLTAKAKVLQYNLTPVTSAIKIRNKKVNSKTFHKAGIVVPVDATEVGYRPLTVTDGELRKILRRITESKSDSEQEESSEELQELITFVQFANDECDYGMGLELGLDLFCFGNERFHNTVLQLLPLAYQLLGRDEFAEIVEAHLKHRDRESLSQIAT